MNEKCVHQMYYYVDLKSKNITVPLDEETFLCLLQIRHMLNTFVNSKRHMLIDYLLKNNLQSFYVFCVFFFHFVDFSHYTTFAFL